MWVYTQTKESVKWMEVQHQQLINDAKQQGTFCPSRWKCNTNPEDQNWKTLEITHWISEKFHKSQHRLTIIEIGSRLPLTNSVHITCCYSKKSNRISFSQNFLQ